MKKMFSFQTFESEQAARDYVKARRLRKYSLHYNEAWKCWTVAHNIYI